MAGILCTCTETTRTVLGERRVRAEHDRLADLFQEAPGFLALLRGPQHVMENFNAVYEQLVGHSNLRGLPVAVSLPEVVEQGFIALLDQVYTSGEPFSGSSVEVSLNRTPGEPPVQAFVNFVYQPLRDATGDVYGILVQGHEVTALRRNTALFSQIIEQAPGGVYVVDTQFRVMQMNAETRPFFASVESLIGRDFDEVLEIVWGPEIGPQVASVFRHTLATGERYVSPRFSEQRHDLGVEQAFEWETQRITLPDGKHGVVCYFQDVTERKLAEAARRESEERLHRLAAELSDAHRRKDVSLATLAHELRNPLAPMRNGLQIMKLTKTNSDAAEHVRAMMDRQLSQLVRLVDDLLDVSRITQGKVEIRVERIDLKTVLAAALEASRPAIEEAGHELTVDVPDTPIFVDGDAARLAQAVSNLLNNSAKYTRRGGHIQMTVWRDDSMAVVAVKDNGIGIPPAMLDRVFEMFTQVDRSLGKTTGGLGIGLSLVKGLVEMHGGTVEAKSGGEGMGSGFVIRLPVVTSVIAGPLRESGQSIGVVTSAPRRILVVDDNVDSAESLGQMLEMLGNEVHTVYDGEDGITAAAQFRPDVVLMDIGMPKLNGYEAARRMRQHPSGAAILLVALTGWGQEDDRRKSADAGFNHHLVKPVDVDELIKLVSGP